MMIVRLAQSSYAAVIRKGRIYAPATVSEKYTIQSVRENSRVSTMNGYIAGIVIGAIVIGLSAVSLEAMFVEYAKIERSSLSAVVCPVIAYVLAGVVDGFMSDGDFVAAYFHYLPGLGVILLMMLMIDALRSWWRRFRQVKRLSRLAHH
jgi:hypothetical protein